jgi:Recombination endonuclease VII
MSTNTKDYHKQYNLKNAAKIKEQKKQHRIKYLDHYRDQEYRRHYNGFTLEQYNDMRHEQGYGCKICGVDEVLLENRLVVDHRHSDNVIRGLLCNDCNSAIGKLREDVTIMTNAINYIKINPFNSCTVNQDNT